MKAYVCYRNGFAEFVGTKYEVVKRYGWNGGFNTFNWFKTPAAKRRGNGNRFFIEEIDAI